MFSQYELNLIRESLEVFYQAEAKKRERQGLSEQTTSAQLMGITDVMLKVSEQIHQIQK
jgi:hypothetical protein